MTIKEELIQIIDKMPEENITRVIELIKSNEYLDEALDMENNGKLITKTIEELENYNDWFILIAMLYLIFLIRTSNDKRIQRKIFTR